MKQLVAKPTSARATTAPAAAAGPFPDSEARTPPAIVPRRMATKVPDSTSALPPTSSASRNTWGRSEYFTGPNREDCAPHRNNAASRSPRWPATKPQAASTITPISNTFTRRISEDFSYLSAICPAVAENSMNGRTKRPAARFTITPLSIPASQGLPAAKYAPW